MNDDKLERKIEDELDHVFLNITSKQHQHVLCSLKKLCKLLKQERAKNAIVTKGGISRLLSLILNELGHSVPRDHSSTVDNNNPAVIELSLLCLQRLSKENKIFKEEFQRANGSKVIENLLLQKQSESVIKRVCSLLVSLYEAEEARQGILISLVNLLPLYESQVCSVTIHRTLWSICKNATLVECAVSADGFQSLIKTLESDTGRILKSTLKVLHRFFRITNGSERICLRVLAVNGLPLLLSLMQKDRPEEELRMVSDCLHYMIVVPRVRVSICGTNFIEVCVEELSKEVDSQRFKNAFSSLCLCAMEAMNRSRMRGSGALQKLVKLLGESKYSKFHFQIVSTFVCFVFDDPSLDTMLRAGLLTSLHLYLERILNLSLKSQLDEQPEDYIARSFVVKSTEGSPVLPSADGSLTNIHGHRGPFQDVLLILAKLSQTRAIRFMVTKACISPLLKYMNMKDPYDTRSERILNRITQNPLFFEILLKLGLVQSIFFQLYTGYSVDDLENLFNCKMSRCDENKEVLLDRNAMSLRELAQLFQKSNCEKKVNTVGLTENLSQRNASNSKTEEISPVTTRPRKKLEVTSSIQSKKCGKSLLSNLTRHAESHFGQGVLAHGLLSDSSEVKEAFVTGFCYICRSPAAIKKIFVDLKGLKIMENMLSIKRNNYTRLCNAVLACKGLADSLQIVSCSRNTADRSDKYERTVNSNGLRRSRNIDEVCDVTSKKPRIEKCSEDDRGHACCILSLLFCRYEAPELCTQGPETGLDYAMENDKPKSGIACFFLERHVRIYVDKEVLCNVSPVFAAMLSSNFVDSSLPHVELQDVHATSFVILLHHVYGCDIDFETLQCRGNCHFCGKIHISEHNVKTITGCATMDLQLKMQGGEADCIDSIECDNDEIYSNMSGHLSKYKHRKSVEKFYCFAHHFTRKQKLFLIADVLRLSDRFMIDALRDDCESHLTGSISNKNVAGLYIEAVSCQARRLATCCVSYMLSKINDPKEFLTTAANLFKSAEADRFKDDLQNELLTRIQT